MYKNYTIQDLETAARHLEHLKERYSNYNGNNPDKYSSQIKHARKHYETIELYLKDKGVLPLSGQEKLYRRLNSLYPNARHKEIVEHEGRHYQVLFSPRERSNSGKTINAWNKDWVEM